MPLHQRALTPVPCKPLFSRNGKDEDVPFLALFPQLVLKCKVWCKGL